MHGAVLGLNSSSLVSCPLVVSCALFECHMLQSAALDIYGQPLIRVERIGSFACHSVYNRKDDRRS